MSAHPEEFLQVSLDAPRLITGFAMQGEANPISAESVLTELVLFGVHPSSNNFLWIFMHSVIRFGRSYGHELFNGPQLPSVFR